MSRLMNILETIEKKFKELFGESPLLIRSPGRVNLIGEHTDYNMGYVLPGAIDKAIYFAISPRDDYRCRLFATDMNEDFEFSLEGFSKSRKSWPNYLMGVAEQMKNRGLSLKGFNCVFGGDIPVGAGLSSSAAIEAGLAFSLNRIFNLGLEKLSLVKLSQQAENEFVGVKCGIMDQYINIFGKAGNLLRIDCRSLENEYFPFNFEDISVVLFDTGVSHSLATSEYNQRRKECNEGVGVIKKDFPLVESLRDVTIDLLNEYKKKIDPVVFKRCRYAVEENERLLRACNALISNDLNQFGSLMYQTHTGLSSDYQVSCPELDYLVELTKDNPRVYGSRMMGGGFGGCTINLIEKNSIDEIRRSVSEAYSRKFRLNSKTYITCISGGTGIIPNN